jgi:hypothetical protein
MRGIHETKSWDYRDGIPDVEGKKPNIRYWKGKDDLRESCPERTSLYTQALTSG